MQVAGINKLGPGLAATVMKNKVLHLMIQFTQLLSV